MEVGTAQIKGGCGMVKGKGYREKQTMTKRGEVTVMLGMYLG